MAKNKGYRKAVKVLDFLTKLVAIIGMFGSIAYVVISLLVPEVAMVRVAGVLQKDYFWISLWGSLAFGCSFVVWLLLKVLRGCIQTAIIEREREDEV